MGHVVIVGAGFAAVRAIKQFRKLDPYSKITLISPNSEFVYLPGIIWIPGRLRSPEDLQISLEPFLQKYRVSHHRAVVTNLRNAGRTLDTDQGTVQNDGVIIACGGRFIRNIPGIEHTITPCKGIAAAEQVRDRLEQIQEGTIAFGFSGNPKEPSAMRGGPMFEFLFGIDQLLRKEGRRDRFNLIFFTPATSPGNRLGPGAVRSLLKEMEKKEIKTHLGHKIKGFTEHSIITEADEIESKITLFMPGLTGPEWLDKTELPRSEGGLIKADEYCQVDSMKRTYVAGDAGSFPGPYWLPKLAHMADIQGKTAAINLHAELNGRPPSKRFKAELLCIVDSYSHGMLIGRTQNWNIVLPKMRLFHWLKRFFEKWYLRRFR